MSGRINPKIWLVMWVIILGIIDIANATERHVPSQYPTIQAAIDAAVNGDTVIVAPGTYTGVGNRDIDFLGKAITVRSTDPNDPNIVAATIIDCNGSQTEPHRGFYFHNGEGPNSVLAGLTITNGWSEEGGVMYCSSSSPTVKACTFSANSANNWGGGMFNYKSSPTVEGCTFTTNLAKDWGGGMFNWDSSPTVKNCTFSGNSADDGGGGMFNWYFSSPMVKGCTFTDNSATLGGGMSSDQNSSPTIEGCAFTGNSAIAGGGMRNDSSPMVEGCIFIANSASNGGGMDNHESSPMVEGCTFSDNLARYGGGMNNWLSNPTVDGCTFTTNSAQYSGGGMCNDSSSPTVTNCILWGNTAPTGAQIYNYGTSSPAISYCDVQGGWSGIGNINANPRFVDAAGGNLHLQADSPCINAGDPNFIAEPNETDIDGESRVMLGRVDMGADEWPGPWMIYVDSDAMGANNGSSWQDAYNHLQDALAGANSAEKPLEIRVAQGIYKPDQGTGITPGDRMASFQLINSVTVKGGYAGFGEPDPDAHDIALYQTILSGDIGTLSDKNDNCYHVFYHPQGLNLNATAILDGFTITSGNANSNSEPYNYGGGMYNKYNSPTVRGCTFSGNSAECGGGMFNDDSSNSRVNGCTFSGNWAYSGGGMFNDNSGPMVEGCTFIANSAKGGGGMSNWYCTPTVESCTFSDNLAGTGGGMYNYESGLTIKNCIFISNSAQESGGGISNYNQWYSSPTIESCTFTVNSANFGGGISNQSSPTVTNCIFTANSADEGGGMRNDLSSPIVKGCTFSGNSAGFSGGMFNEESSPTVKDCTFIANSAQHSGGGMCNYWYSNPTVKDSIFSGNSATWGGGMYTDISSSMVEGCTFTANSAPYGGGMFNTTVSMTVTNCILWADVSSEIYVYAGAQPIVTYSDVRGGYSGIGNINADPRFANAGGGNLHLRADSPCINAGNPNFIAEPNETDIDGELRMMLGRVDMGADEFNPFGVDFVVVNKRRIGRTVFEYECKASLHNISHFDVNNIQLEIVKTPENMTIIDPDVTFGNIEVRAGESATSIDTCSFEVNRAKAIELAEIIWWSRCDLAATGQTMQHSGSSSVILEQITITGDLTGEGEIDLEDLAALAGQWLRVGPAGSIPEDITDDGIINLADFAELAGKWRGGE